MEALKFAFETIIVGVLALPWMLVLVHLFDPGLLRVKSKKAPKFSLPCERLSAILGWRYCCSAWRTWLDPL